MDVVVKDFRTVEKEVDVKSGVGCFPIDNDNVNEGDEKEAEIAVNKAIK